MKGFKPMLCRTLMKTRLGETPERRMEDELEGLGTVSTKTCLDGGRSTHLDVLHMREWVGLDMLNIDCCTTTSVAGYPLS